MMKIIVVGQYYWPDSFLINEITEELVLRGHQVIVLTGLPDYTTSKIPKEYKWGKRRHEYHDGVEIIRVPIIARHRGFLFRVLNYISFFINSTVFVLTHRMEADVIFAYQTAPILMVNAGIVLKKRLNIPFFLYCLDIWPDQMKVWNITEKNLVYRLVWSYCRYAYRAADLVGITSMPFKQYLTEVNNVDASKIVYLPQHSDKLGVVNDECERKGLMAKVNFVFAGNIGKQQNVECILHAVALMDKTLDFMVHIFGDGTSATNCHNLARELDILNKVHFYGRVSKEKLSEYYSHMDVFLLTLRSEKEIGYTANTVPAKFQSYLSAGKPIIAAIDGGAQSIIRDINCGIAVPAGDEIGLSKAMTDYIRCPANYDKCGENAVKYFNKEYEKSVVVGKLENILNKLVQRGNGS